MPPLKQMNDEIVQINLKVKKSLRESASEAALAIDSDLSKELRRAMRELIERAKQVKV
jgi:hypothetical protein